jgi:hypothetical protein
MGLETNMESSLLEICPSHPFNHPELLVHSLLNLKKILDIFSELLILYTVGHCPVGDCLHMLKESLCLTNQLPGILVRDSPFGRYRRGSQDTGHIPDFQELVITELYIVLSGHHTVIHVSIHTAVFLFVILVCCR